MNDINRDFKALDKKMKAESSKAKNYLNKISVKDKLISATMSVYKSYKRPKLEGYKNLDEYLSEFYRCFYSFIDLENREEDELMWYIQNIDNVELIDNSLIKLFD